MRDPDDELETLKADGLRRHLRRLESPQGPEISLRENSSCLNFSSNDYLGLANSEFLKDAFSANIQRFGAGAGASRLICGTMAPHLELEESLAALKRSEAALTFSSGFATATGILPALCGKEDVIILDKLCHASLIDGARLSGAKLRVFPHNDLDKLESHLAWATERASENSRIVVVTETVFSMDGDLAPLADIVSLKNRFEALLLIDEAHAFGVIGPQGRGLAAEHGLESEIDLQMGTFSKAVGLSGGYVCGSRSLIDLFINRARSFIYSTAPTPALAATIRDALPLVSGAEGDPRGDQLRSRLFENLALLAPDRSSAIIPFIVGSNEAALQASEFLLEHGFLVPAIRYPTVPRGTARLRVTVSAAHSTGQVESLKRALADLDLSL